MIPRAALVLYAAVASAAEPEPKPRPAAFELTWDAPPACPDAEAIRRHVEALAPTGEGGEGILFVRGHVEVGAAAYTLALETEFAGHRTARRFTATHCHDLGQSTALVIAIALEPDLVTEVAVPEPPPGPPRPSADDRATATIAPPRALGPETVAQVARPRTPIRRDLFLRLAIGGEHGPLPRVGGAVHAAVGIAWPRARVELVGGYRLPRDVDGPHATSARYQLGSLGARGCARLFHRAIEFPVCGGLDAGLLRVDPRGVTTTQPLHALWVAPAIGGGLAIRGRRVGFWTLAELGVTAVGTRLRVGDTTAFRTMPVAVRIAMGMEVVFSWTRMRARPVVSRTARAQSTGWTDARPSSHHRIAPLRTPP